MVDVRKDGVTVSGHAGYAESGKDIVTDYHIAPLMEYIKELKKENEDLRTQIEALQAITE